MESATERMIGEVTCSRAADRGFCFLQTDDGRSFFLHVKNIRERVIAQPGDLFTFLVRATPNKPDQVEAYDASLVKRANTKPAFIADGITRGGK
jgi:cold shock CspA family protein